MTGLAFTLDLEDHRPDESAELRYPRVTDRLLAELESWGVRGTVFVVGDVATRSPDLVRRVAAHGHELGLHGARHVPLPDVGPEQFRVETAEARDRLAEITGEPVAGFRAPIYSLVPASAWAPEILTDLGFVYSSSVLPARNPLHGWPSAPRRPFRWPSGLVELPCPVFGIGSMRLPLLGGTYLRLAPLPLVRWAARRGADHSGRWLYAHPYDFDPDEPRWVVPEVGRLGSRLLWWNRQRMRNRVRRLVEGSDRTLLSVVADLDQIATFGPAGAKQ